jgi:hypothetical protein
MVWGYVEWRRELGTVSGIKDADILRDLASLGGDMRSAAWDNATRQRRTRGFGAYGRRGDTRGPDGEGGSRAFHYLAGGHLLAHPQVERPDPRYVAYVVGIVAHSLQLFA